MFGQTLIQNGGIKIIRDTHVAIAVNGFNKSYYESLGYDTRLKTILIKIEDVPKMSHVKVNFICDYCSKDFKRPYSVYNRSISPIKKDACVKCLGLKRKESNLIRYGVENVMQVDKHKETLTETIIEKYGVENVFQSEEIKEKAKETMLKKYGVPHNMYVDEFREKSTINRAKSVYSNGKTVCSKQQLHIKSLIGGEINYQVGNLNLDIAFPDEMIYVEYDGGGHDLQVKIGRVKKEDFILKEIRRYKFLKSLGWKQIKIVSPNDYLPSDDIIISEINEAKKALKERSANHYNIYIGDKVNDVKYGHMRKIS